MTIWICCDVPLLWICNPATCSISGGLLGLPPVTVMARVVISPVITVVCSSVAWAVKPRAAAGMRQKKPPQSSAVAKKMPQARRKIC